jgi:uncharacterized membrane protein
LGAHAWRGDAFSHRLLMVSVVFDHAGFWWRNELRRREFRAFGFYSLLIAAAASPFAVLSGIALSKGKREREARRVGGRYLVLATLAVVSMMAAGYWGGEMIIGQ